MTTQQRMSSLGSVLVPVGGSPADLIAIQVACEQARKSKAQVFFIYVIEVQRALALDVELPGEIAKGEEILYRAERFAKELQYPVDTEILQAREVGPSIVDEAAQRDVGLIVMGLPYKRRFGQFSQGDAVSYVLEHATCQVWICRDTMDRIG